VIEQGDGWSEARLRRAQESLAAAVEKADRIVEKAREQAVRDVARESDEMLDPLNRVAADDEVDEVHEEPPALFGGDDEPPARPAEQQQRYLRDAW